jgi:hypothetical protein
MLIVKLSDRLLGQEIDWLNNWFFGVFVLIWKQWHCVLKHHVIEILLFVFNFLLEFDSFEIVLYSGVLYCVAWCLVISCHAISSHLISFHVISCRVEIFSPQIHHSFQLLLHNQQSLEYLMSYLSSEVIPIWKCCRFWQERSIVYKTHSDHIPTRINCQTRNINQQYELCLKLSWIDIDCENFCWNSMWSRLSWLGRFRPPSWQFFHSFQIFSHITNRTYVWQSTIFELIFIRNQYGNTGPGSMMSGLVSMICRFRL